MEEGQLHVALRQARVPLLQETAKKLFEKVLLHRQSNYFRLHLQSLALVDGHAEPVQVAVVPERHPGAWLRRWQRRGGHRGRRGRHQGRGWWRTIGQVQQTPRGRQLLQRGIVGVVLMVGGVQAVDERAAAAATVSPLQCLGETLDGIVLCGAVVDAGSSMKNDQLDCKFIRLGNFTKKFRYGTVNRTVNRKKF